MMNEKLVLIWLLLSMLIIKWFQMGFEEKNVNAELANGNITWTNRWVLSADGCHWEIWDTQSRVKYGTPLELYLEKKDAAKFEPTYRYSSQIFNFLEAEIEWSTLGKFKQIPVRDFLYANGKHFSNAIC
jgi:hypothetical protein